MSPIFCLRISSTVLSYPPLTLRIFLYCLWIDAFVYAVFKVRNGNCFFAIASGDEGIRTLDPLLAGQVLSQLSYTPRVILKWA